MTKFTSKPVPSQETNKKNRVTNDDSALDGFYNGALPIINKPHGNTLKYFLVIFLALIFGLLASFLYNFFWSTTVPGEETKIIIDKQEEVTVTSEERLRELLFDFNQVVVGFYEDNDTNGSFYQKKFMLGSGFVVTTDGWIVTSEAIFNILKNKKYFVLTHDYKKFVVTKVLKDPLTQAIFLKIEADNLLVAKFGSKNNLVAGQLVYALAANYPEPEIKAAYLNNLKYSVLDDVVDSTEKLNSFMTTQEAWPSEFWGAPLLSLSGELVAMVNNDKLILPLDNLKTAISDLGKKEKIDRAKLGIHYIGLADFPKIRDESIMGRGALVFSNKNLTAIEKNSPADKAGLKLGDIITFVENEIINGQKTLTEIIQAYEPGEKLQLTFTRDGKEMTTEVELGKME